MEKDKMENNIIEVLFDKKEDDDLFNLNDDILFKLDANIETEINKMLKFINRRVHPKFRKQIRQLIRDYEKVLAQYSHRENLLFYQSGISDGIEIILSTQKNRT